MNKVERIKAALNSEEVDRVPVSMWQHYSDVDQDPRALAETQLEFVKKFDFDFIKLMPFGTYTVQDWGAKIKIYCDKYKEPIVEDYAIKSIDDWKTLEVLPAIYGTWGKTLQLAQRVSSLSAGEYPFIQTIFSPLTIATKLAGPRIFDDLKEHPEIIHNALKIITETSVNFIKANIEAGVSGFFFATQNASMKVNSRQVFKEFGEKYDTELLNTYKDQTYFNVTHIHGDEILFDEINSNSGNCLNWHDRHTDPDFRNARLKTDKCFLGGIQEVPYFVGKVLHYNSIMAVSSPGEIEKHVHEAIDQVEGRGLILGPGCVTDPKTTDENYYAVRRAVSTYKNK
jgi:uroporphyrinogen decarboxylase